MHPIELMYQISEMKMDEAFNYCRYEMKLALVKETIEFYEVKLKWFSELTENMKALYENENLKRNIQVFKDRYDN